MSYSDLRTRFERAYPELPFATTSHGHALRLAEQPPNVAAAWRNFVVKALRAGVITPSTARTALV